MYSICPYVTLERGVVVDVVVVDSDTADHLVTLGVSIADNSLPVLRVADDRIGWIGTPETAASWVSAVAVLLVALSAACIGVGGCFGYCATGSRVPPLVTGGTFMGIADRGESVKLPPGF